VLLKNNGLLPLDEKKIQRIAVIGDIAHDKPMIAGGGSGGVYPSYIITPLQGIKARAPQINITYANSTFNAAYYADLAKTVDFVVIVVGQHSEEGKDRKGLRLDSHSEKIISAVGSVQQNTIVVLHAPGAMVLPWIESARAVLCSFFPGQENGNALADVLFGDVNPSARLPITFPASEDQTPLKSDIQYPGVNLQTNYTEKLLVGYRWYDAVNATPLFPFGHGLSYTTFQYANLQVSSNLTVSVDIKNSGARDGAEVLQLYLGYPQQAGEPPQVLRDFKKVTLKIGQSATVTFTTLTDRDLSIWDVTKSDWVKVAGSWGVRVGSSSRVIKLTGSFTI
jgi:beta-glucosidase